MKRVPQDYGTTFLDLELENVLVYKQARLKLDCPGITTIRGIDRDSRIRRQTNMVGKSLLVSMIANVLRHAPPISHKKVNRGAALSSGSNVRLSMVREQHRYDIHQSVKGSTFKYRVDRDGEDLKLRTVPIAQRFITDNLCPWNESQFYTLVYLDGRRPFNFQMGSSAQRLEFFTELFNLHDIDEARRKLLARRQELAYRTANVDLFHQEIAQRTEEMDRCGWDDSRAAKLAVLEKKAPKLQAQYRSIDEEIKAAQAYATRKAERSAVKLQLKDLEAKASVPAREAREYIRKLKEYERYQAEHESWAKRSIKLSQRLKRLENDASHGNEKRLLRIERLISKCLASIQHLGAKKDELDAHLNTLRSRYAELKPRAEIKVSLPADALEEKRQRLASVAMLQRLLAKGHSSCPTCGQAVHATKTGNVVEKLRQVEQQLDALQARTELERLTQEGQKHRGEFDAIAEQKLAKLKAELKVAQAQRKEIRLALDAEREVAAVKAQLNDLVEPIEVTAPTFPSSAKARTTDDLWAAIEAHRQLPLVREELARLPVIPKPRSTLTELQQEQTGLVEKLAAINREVSEAQAARQAFQLAKKARDKAEKNLAELQKQGEDVRILDALIDVHGNKGLKVQVVREVAQHLEHTMNDLSQLVFPQPYRFKIEVAPNRFEVNYARKGRSLADVHSLCGAESRAFALLMLAAMLPTVPAHLRSNLVVLDEMDANMSEALRVQMAAEFYPYLTTVVPSVIIVTPDLRTSYPGREVVVVLQNGHSTLQGGP